MLFEFKSCTHFPQRLTIYINRIIHIIQLSITEIFIEFLPGSALCSDSLLMREVCDGWLYAIDLCFMHGYIDTFNYQSSFHSVFFSPVFFRLLNVFLNRKYMYIVQNIQGIKKFTVSRKPPLTFVPKDSPPSATVINFLYAFPEILYMYIK